MGFRVDPLVLAVFLRCLDLTARRLPGRAPGHEEAEEEASPHLAHGSPVNWTPNAEDCPSPRGQMGQGTGYGEATAGHRHKADVLLGRAAGEEVE